MLNPQSSLVTFLKNIYIVHLIINLEYHIEYLSFFPHREICDAKGDKDWYLCRAFF